VTERAGDDEPTPLRDSLAEVGAQLGLPEPGPLETLAERWSEIVGPTIAEHARVLTVRDGVLTVVVEAPAWATQLRYLEDDVVRRAAETVGAGVVRGVRVKVEGPG
jgi:predicted nucleic acid-binding Zn ribbon protein